MIIKWLGHASFKIKTNDKVIYIDPYEGEYDEKADLIFITHSHYDHFNKEKIESVKVDSTIIVCPPDVGAELHGEIMKNGDKKDFEEIHVEAIPSYNVDKKNHPKGEGNGYIITIEGKKIYHSGDTDLIPEMNIIEADLVLLPVGGTYTMDADEAASAAKIILPDVAIPMHYGSIVGQEEDAVHFRDEILKESEIEVKILKINEEFTF